MMEKSEVVCMGDQSPWAGGLLRLEVMRKQNIQSVYFIQDVDVPWVSVGCLRPKISYGWPKPLYFSLATRNPWSLDTPEVSLRAPESSLKTPKGLSRLVGGSTAQTILGMRNSRELMDLVLKMLDEEKEWAKRVSELIGTPKKENQEFDLHECRSIVEIVEKMNPTDIPVRSFVEMFADSKPLIFGNVPREHFWEVDKHGVRNVCTTCSNGKLIVPKGEVLILELASRGWAMGCTGMGYLKKSIDLRDRYLPGLPIKVCYINFNWKLNEDPINALLEIFQEKKRKRKQEVPNFNGTADKLVQYWKNRPTSVSFSILGGNLNPSFQTRIY